MKKQFLYKIFFFTVILSFAACKDPIYFNISQEEKMLEPIIKGSPTDFVLFNSEIYVVSGRELYKYDGTNPTTGRGTWREITTVGGKIFALAATNTNLYAVCIVSDKRVLKVSADGISWSNDANYEGQTINTIYSANNQLFIGAGVYGSYYILCGTNRILDNARNNMLNGVAHLSGEYFLSVKDLYSEDGGGIYKTTTPTSGTATLVSSGPFMGIISANGSVKAITRDGTICNVTPNFSRGPSIGDHLATGALAVWKEGSNYLLLAGRQNKLGTNVTSGYSHGYMEIGIDVSGNITGSFVEPGNSNITTVKNRNNDNDYGNGHYKATIGQYPVNGLFQASDSTLFASTQQNGVWSYRDRKDIGWSWNAED
ncbi:MAG: hypothetical protein LBQ93_10205 [Treponema sp.]|nr:hypothetical protein [Treponema sp.]